MVWVQSIREDTADNSGIMDVSRRLYPIDSPIVGGLAPRSITVVTSRE